jgi:effector-binding domain-containing protein
MLRVLLVLLALSPAVAAAQAPSAPPPATTQPSLPTLVPGSGDPGNADEVVLPSKPAAILRGTAIWDEGFNALKGAFRRIEEELARAAIPPAGRPLTVFVETDDLGFHYEAMIPIAAIPEGRSNLSEGVIFGTTPAGPALRFAYKEPYEDIDSLYETITAYLDAKGVTAKDAFIEEYVTDLTEPSDPNLEVNVFVQPK